MTSTTQITVELPSELVDALRSAVQSGHYASESEFLIELLGWGKPEYETPEELEEIRAAVLEGVADADAGRVVDADEVFDRLHARIEAVAAAKSRKT